MPKPSPSTGPITIKGSRGADHIVIGEAPYNNYDSTQQSRGFIIDGGNGGDYLAGGSGADQIRGGAGFDEIIAQSEDILQASAGTAVYDGGLDLDVVNFSNWSQGIGIDLGSTNISGDRDRFYRDFQMSSPTGLRSDMTWSEQLRGVTVSIEGVIGGSGNDYIGGDWGPNYIDGGEGDDYLEGKYGDDRIIGGLGNDLITMGINNDLVSGDDPDAPGEHGDDIFVIGGSVAGSYFSSVITDYDARDDAGDTQYDEIWFGQYMDWYFAGDTDGTLKIVYGSAADSSLYGQVLLQGLTMADAGKVVIHVFDPMTGMPA